MSRITKKSNSMLGFLRRNLRQASEETNEFVLRKACEKLTKS